MPDHINMDSGSPVGARSIIYMCAKVYMETFGMNI